VAVVLVAVVSTATPSASAETWKAPDIIGDVTSFSHTAEPAPCGTNQESTDPSDLLRDVTGLRVDHGHEAVIIRLSMGEVGSRDTDTHWIFHLQVPAGAFIVDVNRFHPHGHLRASFSKEPHYPDAPPPGDACGSDYLVITTGRECEGLAARAHTNRDVVEVSVPRGCLKQPRWVKVGAEVYGGFTGDADNFTIRDDEWTPPGVARTGFLPPYGPRVRSDG
jgi:hypothetical protein